MLATPSVAASAGTSKTNASISITPSARLSGRFDARPEGGVIIQASRAPLLDAARLLMAKSHSPYTGLEARRPGGSDWEVRAQLVEVVSLDLRETALVQWRAA